MSAPQADDEWLTYFDGLRVSVRIGPGPTQVPIQTTVYEVDEPPPSNPDLPARMLVDALPSDVRRPAYELTDTRDHLSWGASGAFHRVVLYVSEHGLDTAFNISIGAAIVKLGALMRRSLRRKPERLDRQMAEARARQLIVEEFSLDDDPQALIKREESRLPTEEEWNFVFEDAAARYDVTVKDQKPGALTSIRRTLRP